MRELSGVLAMFQNLIWVVITQWYKTELHIERCAR